MFLDLLIILTHMPRIPPVASIDSIWKRRLFSLEGHIRTAHDRLPHVIETMSQMPQHIGRRRLWRRRDLMVVDVYHAM